MPRDPFAAPEASFNIGLSSSDQPPSALAPDSFYESLAATLSPDEADFLSNLPPDLDLDDPVFAAHPVLQSITSKLQSAPPWAPQAPAPPDPRIPTGGALDAIRALGLHDPTTWAPPPRGPRDVGPPAPAPLGFLAKPFEAAMDAFRGFTGLGEQGPPGQTWTNAGQVLQAAMPLAGAAKLKGALAEVPGLFSRAEQVAASLPAKGVHPNKALSLFKAGTSAEELAYRKVPEFLASKGNSPVTAAEMAAHLTAHPAPRPTVTRLGGPNPARPTTLPEGYRISPLNNRTDEFTLVGPDGVGTRLGATTPEEALEEGISWLAEGAPRTTATHYASYQVPGGERYRENLFTLPAPTETRYRVKIHDEKGDLQWTSDATTSAEQVTAIRERYEGAGFTVSVEPVQHPVGGYQPPHFGKDGTNLVVHTRSNERVLPTGERGHYIEEIQSDWHQAGKEQGYALPSEVTAPMDAEYRALVHKNADARAAGREPLQADIDRARQLEAALERADKTKIPDAPFKETWPDLALKQHLLDAANDPNAQWLGVSSADTQIARWGSERLQWKPSPRQSATLGKPAWTVQFETQVGGDALVGQGIADMGAEATARGLQNANYRLVTSEAQLADVMGDKGKAAKAWKRMQANPDGGTYLPRAEGFRQQYDLNLKNKLQALVKRFGGTVERAPLGGTSRRAIEAEMQAVRQQIADVPTPDLSGWTIVEESSNPGTGQRSVAVRDAQGEWQGSRSGTRGTDAEILQDWAASMREQEQKALTRDLNRLAHDYNKAGEAGGEGWVVRLTDAMKAQIRQAGFPLMAAAPIGLAVSHEPQKPAPAADPAVLAKLAEQFPVFAATLRSHPPPAAAQPPRPMPSHQPATPPPLAFLAEPFEAGMDALRGFTGLGEQGPAGQTWTNAGQVLGAALPVMGGVMGGGRKLATALREGAAARPTYAEAMAPEAFDRLVQQFGLNPQAAGRAAYGERILPRLSLAEAEAAGLWHPVGDYKRLTVPVEGMPFRSAPDPAVTMAPSRTLTPADLEGAALIPAPGDRTAAGTIVSEIGGRRIDPVHTEGGVDFMRTHDQFGAAWASKQGVVRRLQKHIRQASEASQKAGGTGEVYLVYMPLSHGATDFSAMMSDAILAQVQAGGVTERASKAFDAVLRRTRPEWKGLYHPDARAQLMSNGELRHAFTDTISLDKFTAGQGFPDLPTTRAAITRPDLMDTPVLHGGQGVAKVSGEIIENPARPHTTYDTQLAGEYAGEFAAPLPLDQMFADWVKERRALGMPTQGDPRSFMLGKPVQVATPKWIKRNEKYLKALGAAVVAVPAAVALAPGDEGQD